VTAALYPGDEHPNGPTDLRALATRYAVDPELFASWLSEGLPVLSDGRADPFAVVNWITWNHLAECPVLRRAWRGYLVIFAGFLSGDQRVRRVRWQRRQRIALPTGMHTWSWLVPRPWQGGAQVVLADDGLAGRALPAGACWRLHGDGTDPIEYAGDVALELHPQIRGANALADAVAPLLRDCAATFHYEYCHHHSTETLRGPDVDRGSCLDAARSLAARLRSRGHDANVVAGVIAHDAFANPHFWVEIIDGQQRLSLDPSLPAIARMLGADWQAVAAAYTGGCDARRVRLMPPHLNAALAGSIGAVRVDGQDAWPCLDWVCGDCDDRFSDLP
jgi:hypothetical protein